MCLDVVVVWCFFFKVWLVFDVRAANLISALFTVVFVCVSSFSSSSSFFLF